MKITQPPPKTIPIKQAFTIAGVTSPDHAGKTLALTVDNQFKTFGSTVNTDGTWSFDFLFQQPGNRLFTIAVGDESLDLVLKIVPAVSRLSFTDVHQVIKTEESFSLSGKAEGFDDGDELVLLVEGKFELARPRVKDGKWQAPVLFHQAGKRLVEVIGSEQERTQIELNVQPADDLEVLSRRVWTDTTTPSSVTNLEKPKRITLHHTFIANLPATASQSDEIERMREIRQGHINRRPEPFSDIGYHYVIMPSGKIYSARAERKRGAHDIVNDGIGVAFDGDYTSNQITQAQFEAAVALCTKLCQRHDITDTVTPVATPTAGLGTKNLPRICGHRDRVNTECPGTEGGRTIRLEDIRQAVNQRIQSDSVIKFPPSSSETLYIGESGSEVKKLQEKLKQLDLYLGDIDGLFDQGVQMAVKEFQESHGLAADGIAGLSTLSALGLSDLEREPDHTW